MDKQNCLVFKFLRLSPPHLALQPSKLSKSIDDINGVTSFLQFPTEAEGEILLGEQFKCYVRIINLAEFVLDSVQIKAELRTERHTINLSDASTTIQQLPPGGSHDLNLEIDVKELKNTIVCGAAYRAYDGNSCYQESTVHFTSCNPLSVHTKTKTVADKTFLELSLGNASRQSLLLLGPLTLDTPKSVAAKPLVLIPPQTGSGAMDAAQFLQSRIDNLQYLRPGGVENFLFEIKGQSSADSVTADIGKLEIRWRQALGQSGRLQTEHITAASFGRPPVSLQLSKPITDGAAVECPLPLVLCVSNATSRRLGPLRVTLSSAKGTIAGQPFVMIGPQSVKLDDGVSAMGSVSFEVTLLPVLTGMQPLVGAVSDDTGRIIATLPDTHIYVRN